MGGSSYVFYENISKRLGFGMLVLASPVTFVLRGKFTYFSYKLGIS